MLRNKYSKPCTICGTFVKEGEGWIEGPPWKTYCAAHKPAPPQPKLSIRMNGTNVCVAPTGFLERPVFDGYLKACHAADGRFDRDSKSFEIAVGRIADLVEVLKGLGTFQVTVDPEVISNVQAQAAAHKDVLEKVSEHLEGIEAALETRGLKLFPFQRQGVEWLFSRKSGLLGDQMGLGKTAQALCSLPEGVPVVIVCPLVAKGVWAYEARRWRPEYQITKISGKSFRWAIAGEIVLVHYDVLPNVDALKDAFSGTVLIVDEAHYAKSAKSLRYKRLMGMRAKIEAANGRVWLLTATPMMNRPPELWSVLELAGLETAFGHWGQFCRAFSFVKGEYGSTWGKANAAAADTLKTVMLRRHREDVLPDLPRKMHQTLTVNNLDAEVKRICDEVLAKLQEMGIDLTAAVENAAETKLSGAAFTELSKARAALATAKIPHALELVEQYEEEGEQVVVFSAHRAPVDALASREGWASITGDTDPDERVRIQQRFQAGELKGLAATIQACGVAVTLTKAHHALFVDLVWTPAGNAQAEDRLVRIGQQSSVLIKRLIAEHPVDSRVCEILIAKQELIEASVHAAAVTDSASLIDDSIGAKIEAAEAALQAMEIARVLVPSKPAIVEPEPVQEVVESVRRHPTSDVERWALEGLLYLNANNADQASVLNQVGFNKMDSEFGQKLAAQCVDGLTDKQWAAAVKMLRKYHRQIGEAP